MAVGADLAVETADEFGERAAGAGQGAKAGLECGHQHGRGDAFAGDVGYRDEERAIAGAKEGVVVVAADGLGGAHGKGYVDAGNIGGSAGDEPPLDFAGDLDVALHGNVIAEDQGEEDQQADEGEKELDFLGEEEEVKIDNGQEGQNDGEKQEQAARGRELGEDAGGEIAENPERALPGTLEAAWVLAHVLFVEAG